MFAKVQLDHSVGPRTILIDNSSQLQKKKGNRVAELQGAIAQSHSLVHPKPWIQSGTCQFVPLPREVTIVEVKNVLAV